jgi:hypothetical protein
MAGVATATVGLHVGYTPGNRRRRPAVSLNAAVTRPAGPRRRDRRGEALHGPSQLSPRHRSSRGHQHPADRREPVPAAGPEPAAADGRLHVLDGHADRRAGDHRRWGRRETYSGRSGKWRQTAGRFGGRSWSWGAEWLTRCGRALSPDFWPRGLVGCWSGGLRLTAPRCWVWQQFADEMLSLLALSDVQAAANEG